MKPSFWLAIVMIVIGTVILLWPDNDSRVISFSEAHGPAISDLIGLSIIIITWTWMMIKVIAGRRQVQKLIGKKGIIASIILIVAGLSMIVTGLTNNSDPLLYLGIGISIAGYLLTIVPAFKIKKTKSPVQIIRSNSLN